MHVDLYRLDRAELDEIGLDADLAGEESSPIEWAERLTRVPVRDAMPRIADRGR